MTSKCIDDVKLLRQRDVVRARLMRNSRTLEFTRARSETCQQNSEMKLKFLRAVLIVIHSVAAGVHRRTPRHPWFTRRSAAAPHASLDQLLLCPGNADFRLSSRGVT